MTAVDMREILLKLAHRLILASWKPSEAHADRLYLYITILQQLGLHKDARELLETESGRFLCSRSLACDYLRRDIMKAGGWQREEAEVAEQRLLEKRSGMMLHTGYPCHFKSSCRDRNWLEFISILDATFQASAFSNGTHHESSLPSPSLFVQHKEKTRELFAKVAEGDGGHDRAGWLGLMELERRSTIHGVPSGM